ncbi:hypothetical protein DICPUDRAFT_86511 [Dictyostelium purpureum]|uniref:Mediator of RNA polymerase II transcription subunit 20 n=1 Tax=Dictyostelium purpureum TaxID=5786 RepID=F0ZC36_DICPU|nr:uncharacterized protein DICPUDRAFT_86511 [Dictyostelium purpureum]EGC38520.1 hypothetical protein DICPUDRAFT_86511 [Dictyostelium purpureum]|eukprot:XP_003284985.1 hypothetical protein DICPUDRAFT_86511 [Dictyostelium purpureum]
MGYKCIFLYKGLLPEISKRIEFLGGVKVSSTWSISCSLYLERVPDGSNLNPRDFYLLLFDEKPKKCFVVSRDTIVETDREMVSILEKTNSYRKRQTTDILGSKYELGDFIIRIGPIVARTEVRGILVEVEYIACSSPVTSPFNCTKLLSEFINYNLGPFPEPIQTSYDFSAYPTLSKTYSDLHTSYQYVNLLKTIQ